MAGAVPDERDGRGWTALMYASRAGCSRIVRFLLEHGADPNLVNLDKGTALVGAARGDFLKTVKVLCEHGAEINAVDDRNINALYCALLSGDKGTVKFLLERNIRCDVSPPSMGGDLAEAAQHICPPGIVKLVRRKLEEQKQAPEFLLRSVRVAKAPTREIGAVQNDIPSIIAVKKPRGFNL